ncbi:hypothetical protein [Candidatus Nitrososphaera gargensis]|nr:hypothetical protein [Candidatus Nitrososphaera gargensis]
MAESTKRRKYGVCQFCGAHFMRPGSLALYILHEHGDKIGSEK